jgi:hypothetical protein
VLQFQYRGQQRERAHHSLGTSFSGSCGKAREELAMYIGSIVFHYLLYLLL